MDKGVGGGGNAIGVEPPENHALFIEFKGFKTSGCMITKN